MRNWLAHTFERALEGPLTLVLDGGLMVETAPPAKNRNRYSEQPGSAQKYAPIRRGTPAEASGTYSCSRADETLITDLCAPPSPMKI